MLARESSSWSSISGSSSSVDVAGVDAHGDRIARCPCAASATWRSGAKRTSVAARTRAHAAVAIAQRAAGPVAAPSLSRMRNAISAPPSSRLMPVQSQPRASGRQVLARPFVIEPRGAGDGDASRAERQRAASPRAAAGCSSSSPAPSPGPCGSRRASPCSSGGCVAREREVEREVARGDAARRSVSPARRSDQSPIATSVVCFAACARPKPARAARWSWRRRPCADRRSPHARTGAARREAARAAPRRRPGACERT